jgi:hypothetical protein
MLDSLARMFRNMSNNYHMRWMQTGQNWDYNMAHFCADVANFFWKHSRRD